MYSAFELGLLAYPISIRNRLPRFALPLREHEQASSVDLQVDFERAYADGFTRFIDYLVLLKSLYSATTPLERKT